MLKDSLRAVLALSFAGANRSSAGWRLSGAAAALLVGIGTATAAPIVTIDGVSSESSATPASPFTLLALGSNGTSNTHVTSTGFTSGNIQISFSGGSPTSGEYAGNDSGSFASPFGASSSRKDYLVAGGTNGDVTMKFATAQTSFSLLWGTVDNSPQNVLTFYNSAHQEVYSISGTTILSDAKAQGFGTIASGDDNIYLTITGITSFTEAIASDGASPSFEFVPAKAMPEPATPFLFAAGLLGLVTLTRRRPRVAVRAS